MSYAAAADVAALIKNFDSYGDTDEAELVRVLTEAEAEINSRLDNYYRAPLTIDLGKAEFLTSVDATAPTAVGDVTVKLTSLSTSSSPQDGRARAVTPNAAIYFEPGTALQERAVVRAIDPTTRIVTLRFPNGRSPVVQGGLFYPHAGLANVIMSSSLDALFLATTYLAMGILTEAGLAAVDEAGKDLLSNRWRLLAIGTPPSKSGPGVAGIMAEVATGQRQFFDAIASGNQPSYPPGTALGTELAWDGVTPNAIGAPVFYKEQQVVFNNKDYT